MQIKDTKPFFVIKKICLEDTADDRESQFDSVCNLSREETNVLCMKVRKHHFNHTNMEEICGEKDVRNMWQQICKKYSDKYVRNL